MGASMKERMLRSLLPSLCVLGAAALLAPLPQAAQDSLASAIPFPHRLGSPDEYASLAMHMIDNPYLNGEVVRLDASLRMAPK